MREIKFRVWDKDCKCMHICGENNHDTLYFGEDNRAMYYNLQNGEGSAMCDLDEDASYVLMQYTGLKDKKRVESYHKDIVRTNAGQAGVIEFGSYSTTCNDWDNSWGWFIKCFNGTQISMDVDFEYWGEVIGNAYANPELLEGGAPHAD